MSGSSAPPSTSSSSSSGANRSSPTAEAPTAAKRRYDTLVADLGGVDVLRRAGKRSKRDDMDAKKPYDKLMSASKFSTRAVNPFLDMGMIMHFGARSRWAEPVALDPSNTVVASSAALAEEKRHVDVFNKMAAILSPDCMELLRETYKQDTHWGVLVSKMKAAAKDAHYQDTAGLKDKTSHYLPPKAGTGIHPPLDSGENKSDRGLKHPVLRDALLPWAVRLQIHEREAVVEDESEDAPAPRPSLTKNVKKARKALSQNRDINDKLVLTAGRFPSCFYAEGEWDADEPLSGLLRSPFLLRVARHIWTAPKSAMDGAVKLKKTCAARAHGQYTFTPQMIAYVACQARVNLSAENWCEEDGKYKYPSLFKSIVELFEEAEDDDEKEWAADTLAWYQKGVFPGGCNGGGSDDESEEDEESDMARIRAARRSFQLLCSCFFQSRILRRMFSISGFNQYQHSLSLTSFALATKSLHRNFRLKLALFSNRLNSLARCITRQTLCIASPPPGFAT
ncbi:hypothetical protein FB45DRAFT_1141204 [Roridomyces roridus]|uniref:Uncharacterized protein n=1 Tax=Roridomyces roridus TaxID=1738132 RepID=A0AAD7FNA4_9AGAR|nr:hypothetical protein FB45DRAFT_1141204 [Roridomyces roridus]